MAFTRFRAHHRQHPSTTNEINPPTRRPQATTHTGRAPQIKSEVAATLKVATRIRDSRRGWSPLFAAVLVIAALVAAPSAASAVPAAAAGGPSQSISVQDSTQALNYWTADRMKNSHTASPTSTGLGKVSTQPADKGVPMVLPSTKPVVSSKESGIGVGQPTAPGSLAAATAEGYWQGSNTTNPNAQIGRLFFRAWDSVTQTYKNYNCSASVVNSENKSVVWTAGHCVYQTYANVWNSNYVFCPGYRSGSCPFGKWTPYSQSTTTQWQNSVCDARGYCNEAEFQYDFGALKMNTLGGNKIANWVGSHGISFNGATVQYRYLFGYPLNKTNGEYLYYCAGNSTYTFGNLRLTPCTAGGGISGGPWLSQINSVWLGVVQSVNSHGDGTYMAGPYQGSVAQSLFGVVRY